MEQQERFIERLRRENPELFACVDGPGRHPLLARAGLEVAFSLPGRPATGSETFMQPRGGPLMLRLAVDGASAFVWLDEAGRVLVRPWSPELVEAAETITSVPSLEAAFDLLAGG